MVPPLPLTVTSIEAVAAQMKAANYRSFPNYVSTIKDLHIEHGFAWDHLLQRSITKCSASTQRGIGPAMVQT